MGRAADGSGTPLSKRIPMVWREAADGVRRIAKSSVMGAGSGGVTP